MSAPADQHGFAGCRFCRGAGCLACPGERLRAGGIEVAEATPPALTTWPVSTADTSGAQTSGNIFEDAPYLSSCSRAQAIEDGLLIDCGDLARQAGFKFPLALTAAVWAKIETFPESLQGMQDVPGRLWDVLSMASMEVQRYKRLGSEADWLTFEVILAGQSPDGDYLDPDKNIERFKLVIGPGDTPAPVMTIMELNED